MTIGLDAALDVRLGQLETHAVQTRVALSRVEGAMRRPPAQPFYFPRVATVTIPTPTADAVIDLGGPAQGRQWDLRNLVIGGLTFATVAAGTALVVVTANTPLTAASVGLGSVVDQAAALPKAGIGYSRGQLRIVYPDRLFVIVLGGTAGQVYVATARLEEYEEAARLQVAE